MQSFSRISAFLALVLSIAATGLAGSPPPWPSWPAPPSAPTVPMGRRGMNPPSEFGVFFNYRSTNHDWYNVSIGNAPVRLDVILVSYGAAPLYPTQGPHMIELFPGGRSAYYTQFLAQLQQVVTSGIPNAQYDGMIVLDYEFFSPWWTGHQNYPSSLGLTDNDYDPIDDWRETLRVTRAASLVGLTATQQEAYFKQEWLATTREFFERTYQAIKAVRPLSKIGVYSQPTQTYFGWRDPIEAAAMRAGHDEVPWFWQMIDVVFPSVYAFYQSVPDFRTPGPGQDHESDYDSYVRANITEALRVANGKPVYPYVSFQYHESNPVFGWNTVNEFNMRHPLDVARELGCNGVVAWGWVRTQQQYEQAVNFLPNTYSPYLTRFTRLPAYAPANPARPQRTE